LTAKRDKSLRLENRDSGNSRLQAVAVIPARGGSKRVPEKNLALFRGKTLIAHTIEQALGSGVFDHVCVSTDDDKITKMASGYAVEILARKPELSGDKATLLNVVRDVIALKGIAPATCVGLLLVTAPLRTVEDVRAAYDLFAKSDRKQAVVSVCAHVNPIDLSWKVTDERLTPFLPEAYRRNIGKQERERTYHFNDACVFDLAENFLREGRNLFGEKPLPYIMPYERSIFVDVPFQLNLVQWIGEKQESTQEDATPRVGQ
jgi:CMP-N-acetylneuraminic acid synthetase